MMKSKFFCSKILVFTMIGAFSLLIWPKDGLAQAKQGSMTGFVFGADKTSPVAGAVVKVRNAADGREYQSMPSDARGLYSVKNLPEGRYMLGISGEKGDYNFEYEIMIKSGEIAKLAVALTPGIGAQTKPQEEESRRKAFFLTPLGIAVVVASVAVLIYGGIQLFGEGDTSPAKK